jgi:hypothetical protein
MRRIRFFRLTMSCCCDDMELEKFKKPANTHSLSRFYIGQTCGKNINEDLISRVPENLEDGVESRLLLDLVEEVASRLH